MLQMSRISWRSASDRAFEGASLGLPRLSRVSSPSFLQRSKLRRDMPSSWTHALYLAPELWASQMSSTALLRSRDEVSLPRLPPRSHRLFF